MHDDTKLTWLLSCGHEIPLLEDDRPNDPPRRPRMCEICGKLRNVIVEP